jgi:bifunctional lysine-specific demethylase and histidyl-hydroxylase MINA
MDVETFVRDIWNHTPWLGRRSLSAAAAHDILNLSSFEHTVAALYRPGDGWLQLARGGRRALPEHMLGDDGLLNLRELYAAFAQGDTLYLTKAERLVPSLARMCRAIELELAAVGIGLRQAVNAHVFLTPQRSQGFPAHRDEHSSLVVQLDGTKQWRVYDRTTEHAALRSVPTQPGLVDGGSLGAEIRTYTLEAGDVLYVPEGWAHEAEAQDAHSLHVTFRMFALRWSDVMLKLAVRHPALASAVPRHGLTYPADPDALARTLGAVLDDDAFRAALPRMLGAIAAEHAVPARVLPDDGLRQVLRVAGIQLDTPVVHRAGAACRVSVHGDHASIAFPGGAVRGPAIMESVFRYVAGAPRFRPCDLPALPGRSARYDRVEVVKTLVRDGLLRIDDDGDDGASDGGAEDRGATASRAAV